LTNQAFNQCLRNKKIFLFPKAKGLTQKELRMAQDDLAEAKDRFRGVDSIPNSHSSFLIYWGRLSPLLIFPTAHNSIQFLLLRSFLPRVKK